MDSYLEYLRHKLPDARIKFESPDVLRIEKADKRTLTAYIENLLRECSSSDEEISRIFERYSSFLEEHPNSEISVKDVIPIIKDDVYLRFLGDPLAIAHEHLAGDLWVIYAVDSPTTTSTLSISDFQKLNITADLRELAITNLRRILPEVQCHGDGPWFLLTAGGDYSASLLLLDDIWEQFQNSVDGDIVATIPARDVLLFTGSHSKEGIHGLRQKAREIHEGGHHVISQTLLRRISARWHVFE